MTHPRPTSDRGCPTDPIPAGGDSLDELVPELYDRLRSLARQRLRRAISGESLQATGLVHEVYLRLANDGAPRWQDAGHFFSMAAQAMRWILVDRARRRGSRIRTQSSQPVEALAQQPADAGVDFDFEALDRALRELEAWQPRKARIVLLRYLSGLSVESTAVALDISTATVKREWRFARAWLARRVFGDEGGQR